jgi:DNA-binding response OmpR family regulator
VNDELPKMLVVEHEPGGLKSLSRLFQDRYQVLTCPVEAVALEYVSESRPVAVLMDASALYLEGSGIVERWKTASPGTRVVFLDREGPWALLMELSETESGQVSINPCALDEIAAAIGELLGGAGRKEFLDDRMAFLAV